jgi:hypothetical protein
MIHRTLDAAMIDTIIAGAPAGTEHRMCPNKLGKRSKLNSGILKRVFL